MIARINHRHEQIANWLVANPDKTLTDCAAYFGYTPAWICTIVHSDLFQALYKRKCEELGQLAVHTVAARLTGLSVLSLEAAARRIESGQASERFISETMRSTLTGMGYGAPIPAASQHLHLHVSAEDLQRARELAASLANGATVSKVVTVEAKEALGEAQVEGSLSETASACTVDDGAVAAEVGG
jgi:hypothetical protein